MTQMEVIDATTPVALGVADEVIDELRERLTGRKADSHAGYEMVRAGIAEVTKYRTGVDRAGKQLKAPAIELQKRVNAEVNRVKGLLLEIETPLREEKARIDDEAERLRKENEVKERLAIEAKELAEKEAREAEEAAQREAERKERDAEVAKLEEQRRGLEAERQKLKVDRERQEAAIYKQQVAVSNAQAKIDADKRAIVEKARKELLAKEAAERAVQEEEERAAAAEAEKIRLAKEKAEQERLAEERKPDQKKLQDFGDRIQDLESPELKTEWGNTVLTTVWDQLQSAIDVAYHHSTAAETVSEQSPVL